jgi:PAS domain S-box-containing protein
VNRTILDAPKVRSGGLLLNPHFWVVAALVAALLVLHYPQEILRMSSPSVFSFVGLSRHAVERILLLLPVTYAGFVFGLKGGLFTLATATLVMMPRVMFISEYFPDAILESLCVIVVGGLTNLLLHAYREEREQRQRALSGLNASHRQLEARTSKLELSERKYRDLLENAGDAMFEQDLSGNIINANRAGELLSGYRREALIGMNVRSFLREDSLNLAVRIRRDLFSGAPIEQPYQQRLLRKNGTVAMVQMTTSLIQESGKPTGFLHIARDVTAGHQLQAALNTMEEGVAVIGQDLRIQFMNPSLVREFGDGRGEFCHQHLYGLDLPCSSCRFSEVLYGTPAQKESSFANGSTFDIMYVPFTGVDLAPCVLATFANITKRKKLEDEMVRINVLHSRLLTEKTERLKVVSGEIARLEEQKGQFIRFLGVVAHDLKSPLSVSQSILSGVTGGYYGPLGEEQKHIIERVTRRIDGLNSLIDDLIDIPLIESGQLVREMADVSLREIVESSVDEMKTLAAGKGLQLTLVLPAELPQVRGSSRRLRQVMVNLLSNAVKYTERGIILVKTSDGGDLVKVEVSDSGIGVLPDDLPRLFDDFFRGRNAAGNKGTGLGLSICRRIVEAHGGKIWVESPNTETDSGCRFVFTVPKYVDIQATTDRSVPEQRE